MGHSWEQQFRVLRRGRDWVEWHASYEWADGTTARWLRWESLCDGHTRGWYELRSEPAAERGVGFEELGQPEFLFLGKCSEIGGVIQRE